MTPLGQTPTARFNNVAEVVAHQNETIRRLNEALEKARVEVQLQPNDALINKSFTLVDRMLKDYEKATAELLQAHYTVANELADARYERNVAKAVRDAVRPLEDRIRRTFEKETRLAQVESGLIIRQAEIHVELDKMEQRLNQTRAELEQAKRDLTKETQRTHYWKEQAKRNWIARLFNLPL